MLKFFLSFANSHQINKLEQDFFWNLEELLWWKAVRTKTCCRRCVRTPISSCPFYICRNATTFSNYSTSAASKNAEEGKNSRRLKRRHRVCYFVFSVSPVEALQAMLASPLVKMILLTVRQPRPGRGRRGPQGQPVSKLFAKSPGLPGTSSPPQCVWILNYLFAFADLLISQEFEWFFVLKTLSRTNMRHNWIHFLR